LYDEWLQVVDGGDFGVSGVTLCPQAHCSRNEEEGIRRSASLLFIIISPFLSFYAKIYAYRRVS
jgi:hypothetical protein